MANMDKPRKTKTFQMTLKKDIRCRAEVIAARKAMSLSGFINYVLAERLEKEEDAAQHRPAA